MDMSFHAAWSHFQNQLFQLRSYILKSDTSLNSKTKRLQLEISVVVYIWLLIEVQ